MATTDTFVYKNQKFTLVLNTGIDLSQETGNVSFHIKKPDGTETTVVPTIPAPASSGLLSYDFVANELNQGGDWMIRTYLNLQQIPGYPYVLSVLSEWEKVGLPTAVEIREYLEGYCLTEAKLSNKWIAERRNSVVSWIEAKIRQKITGTKQYTEYISGTGSPIIWVSRKPIVSLEAVTYVAAPADYAPGLSAIEVVEEEGMLKAKTEHEDARFPFFPTGKYNIKVVYTAGFSTIPGEIYEAVMALTAEKALSALASQSGGGSSISAGGYSRNYGARGKFTEARNELAAMGISLLRKYMTSVVAG